MEVKVFQDNNKEFYFQSFPLHRSQQIVEQGDNYTIFRYYMQLTFDFRQELLSHGAEIEVLSPIWFREEVASIIKEQTIIYAQ